MERARTVLFLSLVGCGATQIGPTEEAEEALQHFLLSGEIHELTPGAHSFAVADGTLLVEVVPASDTTEVVAFSFGDGFAFVGTAPTDAPRPLDLREVAAWLVAPRETGCSPYTVLAAMGDDQPLGIRLGYESLLATGKGTGEAAPGGGDSGTACGSSGWGSGSCSGTCVNMEGQPHPNGEGWTYGPASCQRTDTGYGFYACGCQYMVTYCAECD
jgi:hypothetical protein